MPWALHNSACKPARLFRAFSLLYKYQRATLLVLDRHKVNPPRSHPADQDHVLGNRIVIGAS
jgi:hypothetical protein